MTRLRPIKLIVIAVTVVVLVCLLWTIQPSRHLVTEHASLVTSHSPVKAVLNSAAGLPPSLDLPALSQRADVMNTEPWPERRTPSGSVSLQERRTPSGSVSLQATHTVHYLWCGQKKFQFSHYLGVLSIIRVLQPLVLVFHYTHSPLIDDYNSWLKELMDSVHNLEPRRADLKGRCGSRQMLESMLDLLVPHGGVYVGEGLVLTRIPTFPDLKRSPWFAFADPSKDLTKGVVWAHTGLNASKASLVDSIISSEPACATRKSFDRDPLSIACIKVGDTPLSPKDIWAAPTEFGELSRWLFYGTRQVKTAVNGTGEAIPRIAHYIWLDMGSKLFKNMTFEHFLSVLSALYVGGFQQVWVHGNAKPSGVWWERLKGENVTFLPLELPKTVYQQQMTVPAHISDVLRFIILQKYGGAYQDFDVLWSSRVPDWLLTYPAVVCPDWVDKSPWPQTFNQGVMMARRGSTYVQQLLRSFKNDYRDKNWSYNGVLVPNKVVERYPDTVFIYNRLQVLCCHYVCHTAWQPNYIRPYQSPLPNTPFSRTDTLAVHVTCPEPNPSLANPQALAKSKAVDAKIARHVLRQSGRSPEGVLV